MEPNFTVITNKNEHGLNFLDIFSSESIAFGLVDEIAEVMEERFRYKITDRIEGPDGTGVCDIETSEKKIRLLFDVGFGIEMHPQDKQAEHDVLEISNYIREALEGQNDNSPAR